MRSPAPISSGLSGDQLIRPQSPQTCLPPTRPGPPLSSTSPNPRGPADGERTCPRPAADHLLTPQNAALVVIDYQPSQIETVASIDRELLIDNIVSVARLATAFDLPVVLSTINVAHGQGPTIPELRAVLSEAGRNRPDGDQCLGRRRVPTGDRCARPQEADHDRTVDRGLSGVSLARRAPLGLRGVPGRRRSGRHLA